ncbi:nitric oxide synthase oxygenase [Roseobacter cerasinus]
MRHALSRLRRSDATRGNSLSRRLRRISALERREEARSFLDAFHDATEASNSVRQRRWSTVRRDLAKYGFYRHTPEELAFGARLAWRNHGRCIGRLFWESLDVVDCRDIRSPEAIASRMHDHLIEAHGDGRIRSVISVFPPVEGNQLPAWIDSPQIIQYACHAGPKGRLIGDRQNAEATRTACAMGWEPPARLGQFDLLPWFIRDEDDQRHRIDLTSGVVREVAIMHPEHQGIAALGLRWYTVPVVSNMVLTIGGIDYPCAPFNGVYMGTEIASRNFADAGRYALLPDVGEAIGLRTRNSSDPLWKDRALTVLNEAVLHSYQSAGVTLLDHHTASDQFMIFHKRESAAGRRVAADWRWIVPPQASSSCEVFHLKMRNFHPVPNYYRDRGTDGLRLMPWYGDRHRRRFAIWMDRVLRRWKIWKRMAW